jgi:hypothetical protein
MRNENFEFAVFSRQFQGTETCFSEILKKKQIPRRFTPRNDTCQGFFNKLLELRTEENRKELTQSA